MDQGTALLSLGQYPLAIIIRKTINWSVMEDIFRFADELGPLKLVHIWRPSLGLKAVVAVDNVACGLAIGGVHIAPDVSAKEAFRLGRAMTLKNAAAGYHMAVAMREHCPSPITEGSISRWQRLAPIFWLAP